MARHDLQLTTRNACPVCGDKNSENDFSVDGVPIFVHASLVEPTECDAWCRTEGEAPSLAEVLSNDPRQLRSVVTWCV